MGLEDVAQVSISTQTQYPTQTGFGVPMILGTSGHMGSDRIRYYTTLAGMVSDGFLTTEPEYLMAAKLLAQNPTVTRFAVGKRSNIPTQRFAVTPVAANTTAYKMTISGQVVTYTSDGSGTVAEIIAGLKSAIDALALAVTTSDQTTYLRIVANVAGAFFDVSVDNVSLLDLKQDNADAGIVADISAIEVVDSAWYAVLTPFGGAAEIAALAAHVETAGKIFLAQSSDSGILGSGSSDIASTIKTGAYARTGVIYSKSTGDFADAAEFGQVLPLAPGSENWDFKTLASVAATTFTTTQITNLQNKYCGWYYTLGGLNTSRGIKTGANEYFDVVRGRDWLAARIQERVYALLKNATKVPYTDVGIAMVQAEIEAQLKEAVAVGFLSPSPKPKTQVPTAASVSGADKSARVLNNVKFDGIVAGAINKVVITGTLTL